MSLSIKVGSFNILADGLSDGEFLCEGGDAGSTEWTVRCDKLVTVIANMLLTCDVVVTQENDHFVQILEELRSVHRLDVGGVFGTDSLKPSKARKLNASRQLAHYRASNPTDCTVNLRMSDYDQCNAFFQSHSHSIDRNAAFVQESSVFGAAFASIYGNTPDDLYRSDDGVGIYYRTDKLHLGSVHVPGRNAQIHTTKDMTVVTNMDYALGCTFMPHHTVIPFTLYGAHLRSGEEVTKEHERCRQLYAVFEDAVGRPCPIIAMDSNSSVHYESAYPDTDIPLYPVLTTAQTTTTYTTHNTHNTCSTTSTSTYIPGKLSKLIQQYNYVDAVGTQYQQGNECFKMRHGQGGQPSKYYQFMFDAIDKILVPAGVHIAPHVFDRSEYGFVRYEPTHRVELTELRTSEVARAALERECRGSDRVNSTTCSVEAFGVCHVLSGLYPNKAAPSDHPPVSCTFILTP